MIDLDQPFDPPREEGGPATAWRDHLDHGLLFALPAGPALSAPPLLALWRGSSRGGLLQVSVDHPLSLPEPTEVERWMAAPSLGGTIEVWLSAPGGVRLLGGGPASHLAPWPCIASLTLDAEAAGFLAELVRTGTPLPLFAVTRLRLLGLRAPRSIRIDAALHECHRLLVLRHGLGALFGRTRFVEVAETLRREGALRVLEIDPSGGEQVTPAEQALHPDVHELIASSVLSALFSPVVEPEEAAVGGGGAPERLRVSYRLLEVEQLRDGLLSWDFRSRSPRQVEVVVQGPALGLAGPAIFLDDAPLARRARVWSSGAAWSGAEAVTVSFTIGEAEPGVVLRPDQPEAQIDLPPGAHPWTAVARPSDPVLPSSAPLTGLLESDLLVLDPERLLGRRSVEVTLPVSPALLDLVATLRLEGAGELQELRLDRERPSGALHLPAGLPLLLSLRRQLRLRRAGAEITTLIEDDLSIELDAEARLLLLPLPEALRSLRVVLADPGERYTSVHVELASLGLQVRLDAALRTTTLFWVGASEPGEARLRYLHHDGRQHEELVQPRAGAPLVVGDPGWVRAQVEVVLRGSSSHAGGILTVRAEEGPDGPQEQVVALDPGQLRSRLSLLAPFGASPSRSYEASLWDDTGEEHRLGPLRSMGELVLLRPS